MGEGGYEILLSIPMGGEISKLIQKTLDKEYKCPKCDKKYTNTIWVGWKHDNGLADEEGEKWWASVKCVNCGHGTGFNKSQFEKYFPL